MNWKPGDIAVVISAIYYPQFIGSECEVTAVIGADRYEVFIAGHPSYHPSKEWSCWGYQISKLPPPNEKTSWEDCVWQPSELVTVDE